MDDYPEHELKNLCCTCLSRDRKLSQLCRVQDGVNNLYFLLSYDTDAFREGFYKDTANLYICWECAAIMQRIVRFQRQACIAQHQLTAVSEGRSNITNSCLSQLSEYHTASYQIITFDHQTDTDNFIDCGPTSDIKVESDDDIPLSELNNSNGNTEKNKIETIDEFTTGNTRKEIENGTLFDDKSHLSKRICNWKKRIKFEYGMVSMDEYVNIDVMSEDELVKNRESRKTAESFVNTLFNCNSCIEVFKSEIGLKKHNSSFHIMKYNYVQCGICSIYIKPELMKDHRLSHYDRQTCKLCQHITYSMKDMLKHLKKEHSIQNDLSKRKLSKAEDMNSGSKSRRIKSLIDKRTPRGFVCTECNKCFENKNQKWIHVQRLHKEGFKCSTCGRRFAFKYNLKRHEQIHKDPPPREECPVCHKMIRVALLKTHAHIHSAREQFRCSACDKNFVSRASYEQHLKYSQAHASSDILKYKCGTCEKGYRSRAELRDHFNYQHMRKTQHKCPICAKALATRRCVTRHVRRAHEGIKESPRDKICQQCGKAFSNKKCLREHELIHTGERPLSCELCGNTFRQSASLYTHKRRVHKMSPINKCIQLLN